MSDVLSYTLLIITLDIIQAKFIRSNVYDTETVLDETFDIVYTSYGAINWLNDLDKWAKIISRYLKP